MRKHIVALLAAGAAALAIAATLPAEARPLGGGWSAARTGTGWSGARHKGRHHGYRHRFKGGPVVAAEPGFVGGRYLSDDAWFLSDIGGYLADEPAYPDLWSHGGGYGHMAHPAPVSHSFRSSVSYAVPVHRSHARRRVVTVHRGLPGRAIHHAGFRPGRVAH
jgi:hypothetical protein